VRDFALSSSSKTRKNTAPSRSDACLRKFIELIGDLMRIHSNSGRIDPGFLTIERVLMLLNVVVALVAVAFKNAYT
jgi:hypothetical protein